jgi:predicted small lipoprotein YifL
VKKRWNLILLAFLWCLTGCGVKGKPSAPKEESPIGRGRPSFNKLVDSLTEQEKSLKLKNSSQSPNPGGE